MWCCCCVGGAIEEEAEQRLRDVAAESCDDDDDTKRTLAIFAANWCRSEGQFVLEQPLDAIGVRRHKFFCWAKRSTNGGEGMLRRLFSFGKRRLALSVTACSVGIHERFHLERALLASAVHPALLPILVCEVARPDRLVVVREWMPAGSLRDMLHAAVPHASAHAKYDRIGAPLGEERLARIGRELLIGLAVLRPLGSRACLHVHCGNIFVCPDGAVRLADWEAGLLGLPSSVAGHAADLRQRLEPAAVALALCLYEMACGYELDGLPAELPPATPPATRDALCALLRLPAVREANTPLTLEDAAQLSLLADDGRAPCSDTVPLCEDVVRHAMQLSSARGESVVDADALRAPQSARRCTTPAARLGTSRSSRRHEFPQGTGLHADSVSLLELAALRRRD